MVDEVFLASQLLWPEWPPAVDTVGDDDDTVSSDDDDDPVSSDDDDTSSAEQSDDTFQGLDSSVGCVCSSSASFQPSGILIALLGMLSVAVRRRVH